MKINKEVANMNEAAVKSECPVCDHVLRGTERACQSRPNRMSRSAAVAAGLTCACPENHAAARGARFEVRKIRGAFWSFDTVEGTPHRGPGTYEQAEKACARQNGIELAQAAEVVEDNRCPDGCCGGIQKRIARLGSVEAAEVARLLRAAAYDCVKVASAAGGGFEVTFWRIVG